MCVLGFYACFNIRLLLLGQSEHFCLPFHNILFHFIYVFLGVLADLGGEAKSRLIVFLVLTILWTAKYDYFEGSYPSEHSVYLAGK